METILYQHPQSGNSRKVLHLLGRLGLPFTPRHVALERGAQRSPEYLAINPNGVVPTLVEGDRVLWESHAILTLLALRHEPGLLGEGAEGQAEVARWMAWQLCTFGPALGAVFREQLLLPRLEGRAPHPERVAEAVARARAAADLLERHLEGRRFVAGDFSLADIALASSAEGTALHGQRWEAHPNLLRWLGEVQGTPGWGAAIPAIPAG